ncbi:unnamed protein product [Spirodela intermedia]|uniref:Uncharacterized protein n=1 Tax=Spirodela intermedia TaxID=51605 RepID=A0A7I8JFX4_SPIIN|nr:unnamed protein product [Spirodela intermedia]CAA6668645.1 unnamed protein product [Spirodela intermedia]
MTGGHLAAVVVLFTVLVIPFLASASDENTGDASGGEGTAALRLKLVAVASILAAGGLGVLIPVLGKWVSALHPERNGFLLLKAFAGGVILATALVHILPAAFHGLASPCLAETPWRRFPFAGFVSMVASLATLVVDSYATGYYRRFHISKVRRLAGGAAGADESGEEQSSRSHGGGEPPPPGEEENAASQDARRRIVSQVLELGIVVHSVIIGVTLGASVHPTTIKPLLVALSFHQFFEGIGLGGCLLQASRWSGDILPVRPRRRRALTVEGLLSAASAGILIYVSLLLNNPPLQLSAYISLFLGAGFMSLLARWT